VGERIARLLPLLAAVSAGRVRGDADRSKFWVPVGDEPIRRVTPLVDELFAIRPPLARKGPTNDVGAYLVLLTDEGRAVLAREGSSS